MNKYFKLTKTSRALMITALAFAIIAVGLAVLASNVDYLIKGLVISLAIFLSAVGLSLRHQE